MWHYGWPPPSPMGYLVTICVCHLLFEWPLVKLVLSKVLSRLLRLLLSTLLLSTLLMSKCSGLDCCSRIGSDCYCWYCFYRCCCSDVVQIVVVQIVVVQIDAVNIVVVNIVVVKITVVKIAVVKIDVVELLLFLVLLNLILSSCSLEWVGSYYVDDTLKTY